MSRIAFAVAAVFLTVSAASAQPDPDSRPAASPDMKTARQSLREACAADVKSLCDGVAPGGGKIMRCLKDHKDQISPGCKEAVASLRAEHKAMKEGGN